MGEGKGQVQLGKDRKVGWIRMGRRVVDKDRQEMGGVVNTSSRLCCF